MTKCCFVTVSSPTLASRRVAEGRRPKRSGTGEPRRQRRLNGRSSWSNGWRRRLKIKPRSRTKFRPYQGERRWSTGSKRTVEAFLRYVISRMQKIVLKFYRFTQGELDIWVDFRNLPVEFPGKLEDRWQIWWRRSFSNLLSFVWFVLLLSQPSLSASHPSERLQNDRTEQSSSPSSWNFDGKTW